MAIWDFAHVGVYVAIALPMLVMVGVVILAARLRAKDGPRGESVGSVPPVERTERAMKLRETRRPCDKPEAETSRLPSASPAAPAGLSSPFGTGKTVLVAEDDPDVAWSLSLRLERLGFQVWRSPDALHALLGAERIRPDAAILDVAMPGGNGLAVCEMLASDPGMAQIPRIIHTSRADEATKARCRELGAHYIEKTSNSWRQIQSILERCCASNREPTDESAGNAPSATAPTATEASPQHDAPTEPASASSAVTPDKSPVCGRARVLCIDGPAGELATVEQQLTDLGASVIRTSDKEEGFWTCFTEKPLVVILDGAASGKGLRDLVARFQEHPVTRTLPLVVIGNNDGIAPGTGETEHVLVLPRRPSDDDLLREVGRFIPLGTNNIAVAAQNELPDASSGSPEDQRLTILCIDDDPEIAYAVSMRLEPYGVDVRAALTGSAGFRDALRCKPDLILLDISMPDGEGNYVLGRLKSHSALKAVPVVILTSDGNRAVCRQMLSLGAVSFLTKPVRWQELFAELGQHVRLPERLVRDYKLPAELLLATGAKRG